jgi:hypothetical protein
MGMGTIRYFTLLLALIGAVEKTGAQLNQLQYGTANTIYAQGFDGLPASGSFSITGKGPLALSGSPVNATNMAGWQIWMPSGSNPNAVFAPGTGSSTGNGIYSLGTAGSSDRALGSLSASTGVYSFGLVITNTTGIALNNCSISFTTEQWRRGGSGNRNTWSFRYKTGIFSGIDQTGCTSETSLDMNSVITTGTGTSLNGNLPENRQQVSFTLQHINWKNGEQLLLRWDDADESGSDDVCALDNFSFNAWQTLAAPTATNLPITGISSSGATLNGIVDEQFANTAVFFEYDTAAVFSHPISLPAIPDTIVQGSGNTAVSAGLSNLLTGVGYNTRIRAINSAGTSYSNTIQFVTAFGLPTLSTTTPTDINTSTAVLGGSISQTGGLPITERGIVWSLSSTGNGTVFTIPTINPVFSATVTGLPAASTVYAKAYASNSVGTAYGDQISFITPTTATSLTATDALYSNAGTIHFSFITAQNITGLSASNFALITDGIGGAVISSVTGSGNRFTITINTGSGDGTISLRLINDNSLSVPINNKPFTAAAAYRIDKTAPAITQVTIPNNSMKLGDTVPVNIYVRADTAVYKLQSGKINNLSLNGLAKKNDSLYTATFTISSSTLNTAAEASISVAIVLSDGAGNSNTAYQVPITQSSDPIDATKPFIVDVKLPADSLYKAGDSLVFLLQFSEKIIVTNLASNNGFSSTVGSRTKLVSYTSGSGTDSLLFRYLIPSGDADNDGIRINSPVPLVNLEIRDIAGNPATLSYSFPSTKNILVDAVSPGISSVGTPPAASYRTGNLLDFLVNFSEKVWITTDTLSLGLLIGNNTRVATYTSGSGSTSLLFRYTITDDDIDKDGIKLVSSLNAATPPKDLAGNPASTALSNIGALSGVLINPPTIITTGVSVPPDSIFRSGDTLEFEIEFNENAFVDTKNGIPALKLTIGSNTRQASYTEGSGSSTLLFLYAIQKNEVDSDGIRISTTLSLNNGSIKDEKGNAIPLTLNNISNTSNILVDAADPVVKNVATPPKGIYAIGDTLNFTINFSENIFIRQMDSLFLNITVGSSLRKTEYVNGNGSNSFLFRYIVGKEELDKNGIRIDSVISTKNSLLCDRAGNKLNPTLVNIGALSGVKVDGIAPAFIEQNNTLIVCENAADISISNLLSIFDKEEDEPLNWQLITSKGIVSKQSFTGNANSKTVIPSTVFYRPAPETEGIDSIIALVSDGIYTSRKIITIQVLPAVQHNETAGSQLICSGNIPNIISGSAPMGGDGKYTYQWETSTTPEAAGFIRAAGNNAQSYYAPGKLNTSTWFRRKVFSGGCENVSAPTQIMVVKNGVWTGNYSSNWNNPNNWCTNSIPDQTTDVMINAGTNFDPEITDSASVYRLQLTAASKLKISGVLKLKTAIQNNNGAIDATNGSIILNGTDSQTLSGSVFRNNTIKHLFINNPSSVSLADTLQITGVIILNSGAFITNDHLKLYSTASIGPSALGTMIQGKISMEKNISGRMNTFRLLGHPFYGSLPVSIIIDSIQVKGDSSVYYFDATGITAPGLPDSAWVSFRSSNGVGIDWPEFAGIRLWVQDKTQFLFSGLPHTGTQELRLPKTNHRSFYLVGNPYPAPIEMPRLGRGSGVGEYYWVWDPRQGIRGGYTSIPFTDPHILDPFDAFIIRKDSNASSLLFTENSKSNSYAKDSLLSEHSGTSNFIELRLETDSIFWDRLLLIHSDSSSSYYDPDDAEKIWNNDLNFYSISRDKQPLSADARPIGNNSIIPLGINTGLQQSFRIRIVAMRLPADNTLQLHDKWQEKWIKLERDSGYTFNTTSDTMSSGDQRFEIASYKAKVDTGVLPHLIVRLAPVPAHQNTWITFSAPEKGHTIIRLLSSMGVPIKEIDLGLQQRGHYQISLTKTLPGIYFIELSCGEQTVLQKLIVQ